VGVSQELDAAGVWTNSSLRLKPEELRCREIGSLAEYANHFASSEEWCMVRKVPAYYHGPHDVACLDGVEDVSIRGLQSCPKDPVLEDFSPEAIRFAHRIFP
jgi:hypothetical protein